MAAKPRLAITKLSSCDGCQLTLLGCEDELLALAGAIEIVYFAEATSRPDDGAPFDLTLIEGSISTPEQIELVHQIRARSRKLITIGACATAGGIQALRNWADSEQMLSLVYARPEYIKTLATSTPVAAHVRVDFELRGCPIDKRQLVEVISAFLNNRKPVTPPHAVCVECKLRGNVCVMVARGEPCLGPVTHAGCGALCPTYDRGCYGCFGPRENANTGSLAAWFQREGMVPAEVLRRFRGINNWADAFREESKRHGR